MYHQTTEEISIPKAGLDSTSLVMAGDVAALVRIVSETLTYWRSDITLTNPGWPTTDKLTRDKTT
ncbi:hypothetical protein HW555_012922 [Spodoptera exigua]|uniref:Uncharacterized protein n=1 Tax=Spodoptera exigua TaxID=7107 RepID=A0A835KZ53_SPOEX|nr:hypothetical protein HW555_012922 [Spodoptera exigua]